MSKIYKAMNSAARTVDGVMCFVLIGQDERGNQVEIAVPAHGLKSVFAEADRAIHAAIAQSGRQVAGDYMSTVTRPGTPAQVGTMATTEGETVVLTIHPNLPSEMALSYSETDARALAEELVQAADRAAGEMTKRPKPN